MSDDDAETLRLVKEAALDFADELANLPPLLQVKSIEFILAQMLEALEQTQVGHRLNVAWAAWGDCE